MRLLTFSFETAALVLNDPDYIEMFDFEHSIGEERFIAIGKVGEVLFVVFTERKDAVRLISARLATSAGVCTMTKTYIIEPGQTAMMKAVRSAVIHRNRQKQA